jgi:ADP-ribose pyrophosphatase YjhB (NUDIX family)
MPPFFSHLPHLDLSEYLAAGVGAFGAWLWSRVLRWKNARKVRSHSLGDLVDVSLTSFQHGAMHIRTQWELPLTHLLAGELNETLVRKIQRASQSTRPNAIILSQESLQAYAKLINDAVRNQIYGRQVNVLDVVGRQARGEVFESAAFVGALTCEPRFRILCEEGVDFLEVLPPKAKPEPGGLSKQKIRVLLFPRDSIQALLAWTRREAPDHGTTPSALLDELCNEHHVEWASAGSTPEANKIRKRLERNGGVTQEGAGAIDHLIKELGTPPRPLDRKRYVAMAQVARLWQTAREKGTGPQGFFELEVPIPRPASDALFFPGSPDAERDSLARLSHPRKIAPLGPGELYYHGPNGTATGLVTRGDSVLLLRKTQAGKTWWALPGGFLRHDDDLDRPLPPREELARELAEEAIACNPGEPQFEGLRERTNRAELIFVGRVRDPRETSRSWVRDHVYALDLSDFPGHELRARGVRDDAEEVGNAQWMPLAGLFREPGPGERPVMENCFASHGPMLRAWLAREVRRSAAGFPSILDKLDEAGRRDLQIHLTAKRTD